MVEYCEGVGGWNCGRKGRAWLPEGRAGWRQQKGPSGCLMTMGMMDREWEGGGGGPILASKPELQALLL